MNVHSLLVQMDKTQLKRQKIIDTAVTLFVKHGIHGASMQTLAKQAGVATGSIYNYFDSKDSLVVGIFHSIVEEKHAFLNEHCNQTKPTKAQFYNVLEHMIRFDINHPEKFRFMRVCAYEPIIMKIILNDDILCKNSLLANVLEQGKIENQIKSAPLYDLLYHIFGGISALLEWRLFNQKDISDVDINNMIDMAWHGIRCQTNT